MNDDLLFSLFRPVLSRRLELDDRRVIESAMEIMKNAGRLAFSIDAPPTSARFALAQLATAHKLLNDHQNAIQERDQFISQFFGLLAEYAQEIMGEVQEHIQELEKTPE